MGKYEEDSNRNIVSLTLSFLKFILVVCNVRCNNWETYLSGRKLCFCHSRLISAVP